jgi:hypothetical protein
MLNFYRQNLCVICMQGLYDFMVSVQVYKLNLIALVGQGENCKLGAAAGAINYFFKTVSYNLILFKKETFLNNYQRDKINN